MINIPAPPKQNETQSEFMKRCVPVLRHEGYPDKQSVAICYSMWRKKHPQSKKGLLESINMSLDNILDMLRKCK